MQKTRICVTIRESQMEAVLAEMARVSRLADLIEIRADYIKDLNIPRLFANKTLPVIFTCRSKRQGGEFEGDETRRLNLLIAAADQESDYIDVENDADYMKVAARKKNSRLILSYHNFTETPEDLEAIYRAMASTPADVIKMATYAHSLQDTARLIELSSTHKSGGKPTIVLSMGARGAVMRILGPLYGSFLTYASSATDKQAAPGQIGVDALVNSYRVREINGETKVLGLLGNPVAHSLSPLVHNAAFRALGLNAVYVPFDADSLPAFFALAEKLPLLGFSVTIPYKVEVMRYLDEVTEEAAEIGAVNTVLIQNGKLIGYNTDVSGFIRPLEQRTTLPGKRALIIGAGGAARAAAYALRKRGVDLVVVGRTMERVRLLADAFSARCGTIDDLRKFDGDLLIHTTSVGMFPDTERTLAPKDCLRNKLVYDMVYNPAKTRLLREAEAAGCATISGIEMFIYQAAEQFRIWTTRDAPIEVLREVALKQS